MSVILGDCLEKMRDIHTGTVDMILTDLPYGTTQNKWDDIIDLKEMWNLFHHVLKETGVVCLTATQPFTSKLVMSNLKEFKYEWIWQKEKGTGFFNAKKQPLRCHESILLFYSKQFLYNPQMNKGEPYNRHRANPNTSSSNYNTQKTFTHYNDGVRYPITVLKIPRDYGKSLHPTQKPVKLFEYLIKTYTNEGDIVLDCCAGSGTTGEACKNLNREYILIEKEKKYYDIILERLK